MVTAFTIQSLTASLLDVMPTAVNERNFWLGLTKGIQKDPNSPNTNCITSFNYVSDGVSYIKNFDLNKFKTELQSTNNNMMFPEVAVYVGYGEKAMEFVVTFYNY